jgi:phage FluMu protein Com
MNLRCAFCQTPYALGRTEMLAGLQMMEAENLSHYDAHCPRCRRVTQIPRQKLEMAFPNWKEALKEAVSEASAAQTATEKAPAGPEAEKPTAKSKASAAKSVASKVTSDAGKKVPAKKAPRQRTSRK